MKIFYATNRRHIGKSQFQPDDYENSFSADDSDNLRFGKVSIRDGKYKIKAFKETLLKDIPIEDQPKAILGSDDFFKELKKIMMSKTDVIVYIHGYNVDFHEAIKRAETLQDTINKENRKKGSNQRTQLVVFSWPSVGRVLKGKGLKTAYCLDRSRSEHSGKALGRAFEKLYGYLVRLEKDVRKEKDEYCHQNIHLLCHSMGNHAFKFALDYFEEQFPGRALPTLFKNFFSIAADVRVEAFEKGEDLSRASELAEITHIIYNQGDLVLHGSDILKGNSKRLGSHGPLWRKIADEDVKGINCSSVITYKEGKNFEHSYFSKGLLSKELARLTRLSLDDLRKIERVREL